MPFAFFYFALQASTQYTEPHQPGLILPFFKKKTMQTRINGARAMRDKTAGMAAGMKPVTLRWRSKNDCIKSRPLSTHPFAILCDKTQKALPTRTEKHWPLGGKALGWFSELWAGLAILFLMEHHFYWENDWETNYGCIWLSYSDWVSGQTFSWKWTKWACHFKEVALLLPVIKLDFHEKISLEENCTRYHELDTSQYHRQWFL